MNSRSRGLMRQWRKARELSWPDRWLFLQAWLAFPVLPLILRPLGFRRTHHFLHDLTAQAGLTSNAGAQGLDHARAIARLVHAAAARTCYTPMCLHRSLLLWTFLRRRGIAGHLRLGVRKEQERLQAHAWVEYEGSILNDAEDVHDRFAPLERIKTAGENRA
ncbi:MAG: lasso peptide biosynthesis B2 protein [Deltaproteobacteria bacterium]|nr:lasso peptide biosynthesis B2 protein [Deltaproteobacteria bacterium]